MSVKVYNSGGVILAEELGKDTKSFTPQNTDLWVSGDQVGFTDMISKETVNFGSYTNILDSNNQPLLSLNDTIVYISKQMATCGTIDQILGSMVILGENEHNVHIGNAYYASKTFTLLGNATINFLAVVPSSVAIHMKSRLIEGISVSKNVNVTSVLYEDSDYSGGGIVPIFNSNRNSSNTSSFTITSGSSGTVLGNNVDRTSRVVNDKNESSQRASGDEYIMKSNSSYLLEISNNINDAAEIVIRWQWYEV